MKRLSSSLTSAAALVLGTLAIAPTPASAIPLSYATAFSGSASVTDTCGPDATNTCNNGATNAPQTLATASLPTFDKADGVLMGATVSVTSTKTGTISGGVTTAGRNTQTSGSGSNVTVVTGAGVNATVASGASATGNCTGGGCTYGPTTTTYSPAPTNVTVGAGSLNSYVTDGAGSAALALAATALQASSTFSNNPASQTATSTTTYQLDWSGNLNITYDYLLHAAPSFAADEEVFVLSLDFGTVALGSLAELEFDIHNLSGSRVGLDLDNVVKIGAGDPNNKLDAGLAAFLGLAAGSYNTFTASMITDQIGSFSAQYVLSLSDMDVGASASRRNDFQLLLNLTGSVFAPLQELNSVPEPATVGLLGLSLAALALGRRRRMH